MNSPRCLPKIRIGQKRYFVDDRLKEFRNVENPHDRIEFADHPLGLILLNAIEDRLDAQKAMRDYENYELILNLGERR